MTELIGTWDIDGGYEKEPNGARLQFLEDGSGYLNPHAERMNLTWKIEKENELTLTIEGNRYGPFKIEISEKEFSMGSFWSLESQSPLLPFGIRKLQKIQL